MNYAVDSELVVFEPWRGQGPLPDLEVLVLEIDCSSFEVLVSEVLIYLFAA